MQTIYLISGPLGVGKSSTAIELVNILDITASVEGDIFFNATENSELSWQERLEDAWRKILQSNRENIAKNLDVVIDFVVEDELEWFCSQFTQSKIEIKYIVLMTDKSHIIERLKKRGELKYQDRAMVLLDQLSKDPRNTNYIHDNTDKTPKQTAQEIITSPKYIVKT